jgi:hypothetical protein
LKDILFFFSGGATGGGRVPSQNQEVLAEISPYLIEAFSQIGSIFSQF